MLSSVQWKHGAIGVRSQTLFAADVHENLGNTAQRRVMQSRRERGLTAYARGMAAEEAACSALAADGWTIHGRRLRTRSGEVDVVAEKSGVLSIVEVKSRPTLKEAAVALTVRQQARLAGACEIILAEHPGWGTAGVRFDILLVDREGRVRRIADAFRVGDQAIP